MKSIPLSDSTPVCPRHLSDDCLVAQAKLGSERAFAELWNRHGARVRSALWRIIRNREDIEDVMQEVHLKSFLRLASFRGDSVFSTWLIRIAMNLAFMLLRRRRSHPEVFIDSGDADLFVSIMELPNRSESIEVSYFRAERLQELRLAIRQLPFSLRNVVELQNEDELSVKEIAHQIGISVAAVKARLYRARAALRELTSQRGIRRGPQRSHRWPAPVKRASLSAHRVKLAR